MTCHALVRDDGDHMIDFGLSSKEFAQQYLDKRPYVHNAALASSDLNWAAVDQVLAFAETDSTAFQLFLNGQLPPQAYSEDSMEFGRRVTRVNKHRFYELLQRGATLVINQIEKYSLEARKLGIAVSRFAGMQTTSNAYVSFGGSGTFGRHWDTHDVVVLQLQGKKHWQIFAPSLPLPLSHQTSERMKLPCPATPEFEIVLECGDLLYIPRGWWHNVTPLEEASMHLSVGLYAPAVIDYIGWLCARYLPSHLNARRMISSDTLQLLPGLMEVVAAMARDPNNYAAFAQETRQHDRLISEFNTELMANSTIALLPDESLLMLNTASLMLTAYGDAQNDADEMRINGGRIKLDPIGQRIVKKLSDKNSMTFADLCTQMNDVERAIVAGSLLGLARHELINISRSNLKATAQ